MKRSSFALAMLLCLIFSGATSHAVSAKDTWTSVRSKNFYLIGNASEKEIRQVATKLEQFRYVFTMLLTQVKFSSPVPTTVVVFKSDNSYKPFKNNPNMAGYFQPGPDVNYITLTVEQRSSEGPYRTIFHEYVHLLINNTLGRSVPKWFNEGLAEYYSTFRVESDEKKVILGDLIGNHVLYLRDQKVLPLRTLFTVDEKSPYYNEGNKMNVFYAESWMLLHYLLQGNNGQRREQLGKFVALLDKNIPVEEAFKQSFQVEFEGMEKEFKSYIRGANYMATSVTFKERLVLDSEMQASPLGEADAQAYLGDLLLHTHRLKDAESHLQQALTQDPNLMMAHASLGMLRFREGRLDEARASLERAIGANSNNYLAHYYYAFVLSRQGTADETVVNNYPEEIAKTIRFQLKKAIALNPDFPESYNLLAFVNLVNGEQLDESVELLQSALKLSPGKTELNLMLAQIYLRKEDFTSARRILEPIARSDTQAELTQRARVLLEEIHTHEEQLAQYKAWKEANASRSSPAPPSTAGSPSQESANAQPSTDPSFYLQEALRQPAADEVQIQGTLVRIDCAPKSIVFVIQSGDRLLKIKTDSFENVDITTYTREVAGEIRCGPRKPENAVVVCYVPSKGPTGKVEGTAKSVEFVPKDFKLSTRKSGE
jgi:tetratricopeptide (TPR) repeat protein